MRNECSRVTRRRLILETGGALTAALLPRRVAIAAEPAGRVITELSRYLARAKGSTLPANVIEKAKRSGLPVRMGAKRSLPWLLRRCFAGQSKRLSPMVSWLTPTKPMTLGPTAGTQAAM
jgi:hypothetical protein